MTDRLPFTAPGRATSGNGDSQSLDAEARRLMFQAKLLAGASGVPVLGMRREMGDGSVVTAQLAGPVERVTMRADRQEVPQEEPIGAISRLVWFPEGFVITPRSPAAPLGYGMPNTSDGLGTPLGPLRQVIINRFKDNQYPDAVLRAAGGKVSATHRNYCAAPLFYMDWEARGEFVIGARVDGRVKPQFRARWQRNYSEAETATWYCHRPTSAARAELDVHKSIREETNLIRAAAGRGEVHPPLRGYEGMLSELVLYLNKTAKVLGHDSRSFRDGHLSFEQDRYATRAGLRGSVGILTPTSPAGENIFLTTATDVQSARFGAEAVEWWRGSPAHYANMVRDWAADEMWPTLDSATRNNAGVGIEKRQVPPYSLDSEFQDLVPPVVGSEASQIFMGMENFVLPSVPGQEGPEDERVGIESVFYTQGHGYFIPTLDLHISSGMARVRFKGRAIDVHDNLSELFTPLAARFHTASGRRMLRVAGLARQKAAEGPQFIVLFQGLAHDFYATRQELGRFRLPDNLGQVSYPKFSESGARMVISYTEAVSEDQIITESHFGTYAADGGVGDPVTTATTDAERVWGEVLHFVEWHGGTFAEVLQQSLDVTVGWGSTWMRRACRGSYRLFADYQGESIVYASVEVDSELFQDEPGAGTTTGPATYYERTRLRSTLVFPDGTRLPVTNTDTDESFTVSGYFCHLLYLDILRPERTALMRYEMQGTGYDVGGLNPRTCSMSIVIQGQTVKSKENVLFPTGDEEAAGRASQGWTNTNIGVGFTSFLPMAVLRSADGTRRIRVNPAGETAVAAVTHKASLVGMCAYSADVQMHGATFSQRHSQVGTSVSHGVPMSLGSQASVDFLAAFHRDEFVYAGKVSNTIRVGPDYGTAWYGDDEFIRHSSLPLEQITGIPDLAQNILPIGVL